MDGLQGIGRMLLIAGLVLAALGALLLVGGRFGLGRLPGDIAIEGKRGVFYFPIVTSIVLSLVLTLILWLVAALRR